MIEKHRAKWEDNLTKDARSYLNARTWRRGANDRKRWKRKIEDTKHMAQLFQFG